MSDKLESWKEIAAHLGRDVRTVVRWEKLEGLPVHRHPHDKQATIYAYRSEIDAWLGARSLHPDDPGSTRVPDEVRGEPLSALVRVPRLARVGFITGLLVLVAVVWTVLPELLSRRGGAIDFQERDWILIADIDNRTGRPLFDDTLELALARELSISQFVNVASLERIGDALRLMRRDPKTRLDTAVAREICLRDGGIALFLSGQIQSLGEQYRLTLHIIDPGQGLLLRTRTEEATDEQDVLRKIHDLAAWTRVSLGEELPRTQTSGPRLERVTTASLQSLETVLGRPAPEASEQGSCRGRTL